MAKVVAKTGIKKEPGYLYFVDKDGDISRAEMARRGRKKASRKPKQEKVAKTGVAKEQDFLYFVDKNGDIACAKMAQGRKPKK